MSNDHDEKIEAMLWRLLKGLDDMVQADHEARFQRYIDNSTIPDQINRIIQMIGEKK